MAKLKKQKISVVGTVLTLEYPSIGKKFSVDFSKYPAEVQVIALAHGFKQKFGDAESGGTAAEKFAEVQEIHGSLLAGMWERKGERDLTPIICEAVARIKKIPLKKILQTAEAAPEMVLTWRSNIKVKAEILKIRAERAAKLAEDSEEDLDIDLE